MLSPRNGNRIESSLFNISSIDDCATPTLLLLLLLLLLAVDRERARGDRRRGVSDRGDDGRDETERGVLLSLSALLSGLLLRERRGVVDEGRCW